MRKIKRTSLTPLALPLLFIGCMQHEKVSSISPVKTIATVTQINSKEKTKVLIPIDEPYNLEKTSNNNRVEYSSSDALEEDTLDSLARSVLANMTVEIKGTKTVPLEPIEIEDEVIESTNIATQEDLEPLADETLSGLANDVIANLDININGNHKVTTKPLEVGENWKVITKEDEIVKTAKRFLGVRYAWAANGPYAFDCSGFTKYIFEKHGISLPRYSGYQAHVGRKISYKELKKGDLVFFATNRKGKVNHVGIFMGNHKFIHASSGGKKVMITSFKSKKFYRDRFLHGQRVIKAGHLASL